MDGVGPDQLTLKELLARLGDGDVYKRQGKTTLIKMMMTLLFPTQGIIMWDGVDIRTLDADYRDVIGYLPQDFGYYKGYTCLLYTSRCV